MYFCRAMPKIYKYLGIIIYFYSTEHKPIHVHGKHAGHESKAEFIMKDGVIIEIKIRRVARKNPLKKAQLLAFKEFAEAYQKEIVNKWIDFFVYNKRMEMEEINTL